MLRSLEMERTMNVLADEVTEAVSHKLERLFIVDSGLPDSPVGGILFVTPGFNLDFGIWGVDEFEADEL